MIKALTSRQQIQMPSYQAEALVREVLEPDQLSSAKQHLGRRSLNQRTLVLLWALRIYLVLMAFLIAFQVWNVLHAAG